MSALPLRLEEQLYLGLLIPTPNSLKFARCDTLVLGVAIPKHAIQYSSSCCRTPPLHLVGWLLEGLQDLALFFQ